MHQFLTRPSSTPTRRRASRTPTRTVVAPHVLDELRSSIGQLPAESGAILGKDPDGVIRHVRFDSDATRTSGTYSPDTAALNRLLRDEWNPVGIRLAGFAHSHPASSPRPSEPDRHYANRILAAIDELDSLFLPIIMTVPDAGEFELLPFVAERQGDTTVIRPSEVRIDPLPPRVRHVRSDWFDSPGFERVAPAVSLPLLARCRLIVVGAGGSAAWVETMVRSGVGEVVLIDPDTVAETNLATQQTYRSNIGRAKVLALRDRLHDINPHCHVTALDRSLDDVTDERFARLSTRALPGRPHPEVSLLCALTDDFWAQARVNRLALHLGLPVIAAQVYEAGRGVEVSFAAPGITPACGRCVLGNRYRAWLEQGWSEPGRSVGTPLPATDRLNALKGFVALALLHGAAGAAWGADPASLRWRSLLPRLATRNLVQVRLDPDVASTLGLTAFDRTFKDADRERLVFDEAIWLPQVPEHAEAGWPACPDCGGSGDLRDVIGTIERSDVRPVAPLPVRSVHGERRRARPKEVTT